MLPSPVHMGICLADVCSDFPFLNHLIFFFPSQLAASVVVWSMEVSRCHWTPVKHALTDPHSSISLSLLP